MKFLGRCPCPASIYIRICDLRAKLLVVCLVTPALWLNLSDSRNILIIHFGTIIKGTYPRFNWT